MMKRLLLAVSLLAAIAQGAFARTVEQQLISSLQAQGYVVLEQGYTFLGRLRIVAENDLYHREIVVNPGTGEILRDYAVTLPRGDAPPAEPVRTLAGTNAPGAGTSSAATATVATGTPDVDVTSSGDDDAPGSDVGSGGTDDDGDATDMILPESILLVPERP